MKQYLFLGQGVRHHTVKELKRTSYVIATLFGVASMITELVFGSPTHTLSPNIVAFDRIVFPILILLSAIAYWIMSVRRGTNSDSFMERIASALFPLFFLSKIGLALFSQPSVPSLAFVESWHWMLIAVWLVAFLANDFKIALLQNLLVYSGMLALHVASVWIKTTPDSFVRLVPEITASHFRLIAPLTFIVILGHIKDQWLIVEEEASNLRNLAHMDTLTTLPNRRYLHETLIRVLRPGSGPVSVILFDLDGFKQINDQFGHAAGDEVLALIGRTAPECIRTGDIVGRWGGEEFLVICPDTTLQDGLVLAERLRQAVERLAIEPISRITASFGVAERRKHESPEQLIARADDALYEAKKRGKNTMVGHDRAVDGDVLGPLS